MNQVCEIYPLIVTWFKLSIAFQFYNNIKEKTPPEINEMIFLFSLNVNFFI